MVRFRKLFEITGLILLFRVYEAEITTEETEDPIVETRNCLERNEARQEAIARCFKIPQSPGNCSLLIENMNCFINTTKSICNDFAYKQADFTFYKKLETMMLSRPINRNSSKKCYNDLSAHLFTYYCQACTEDDPKIQMAGDLNYLEITLNGNDPSQCRTIQLECKAEAGYWKSKLTLMDGSSPGVKVQELISDPGESVALSLNCTGNPVTWRYNNAIVKEVICESKYAEEGCAMCDALKVLSDNKNFGRPSIVNGCKVYDIECQAPPMWRNLLTVVVNDDSANGKNLSSLPGGTIKTKISCIGDRNTYTWTENQLFNLTNITSVTCIERNVEVVCNLCNESSITWGSDVIKSSIVQDDCTIYTAHCSSANPTSQSQFKINDQLLTSAPGGSLNLTITCIGDRKTQNWAAEQLNLTNITSVSCDKAAFNNKGCSKCFSPKTQMHIRGEPFIKAEHGYDKDGCHTVKVTCLPVNQKSIASLEYRKYGVDYQVKEVVAPKAGAAIEWTTTCNPAGVSWKYQETEYGCYTKKPVDLDCSQATVYAPKIDLYEDPASSRLIPLPNVLNAYNISCTPKSGFRTYWQMKFVYPNGTEGRWRGPGRKNIPVLERLNCVNGKYWTNDWNCRVTSFSCKSVSFIFLLGCMCIMSKSPVHSIIPPVCLSAYPFARKPRDEFH